MGTERARAAVQWLPQSLGASAANRRTGLCRCGTNSGLRVRVGADSAAITHVAHLHAEPRDAGGAACAVGTAARFAKLYSATSADACLSTAYFPASQRCSTIPAMIASLFARCECGLVHTPSASGLGIGVAAVSRTQSGVTGMACYGVFHVS